jgi:vacuolar-type H+-ATPase subunit F/Vma7
MDHTRVIVLGSSQLTDGFRLIGVEVYPDATPETLESLLQHLETSEAHAFVLIEQYLARSPGPWLRRVRDEGGRIVVTELPALNAPGAYQPAVDELIRSTLGPAALEVPE